MKNLPQPLDEQIRILRQRNLIITDEEKAKEILLDIGYYRLGFYWYAFEEHSKMKSDDEETKFIPGATFKEAVSLYYFDYDLSILLLKYITRIEIHFRTYLQNQGSKKYPDNPFWFITPGVVNQQYIRLFNHDVYNLSFKKHRFIRKHHLKHKHDCYAPAWKTLEFMTLGNNVTLYKSLLDEDLKRDISQYFGIKYTSIFENYIETMRHIRNLCAHHEVLYDTVLYSIIRKGPANVQEKDYGNIYGSILVIKYLLCQVSVNRANDFELELRRIYKKHITTTSLQTILEKKGGFAHF
jgi:abortive infection bacteriophage resistance protein